MGLGIDLFINGLGVTLETLICIFFFMGGIIFYVKDFKLGVMLHLITFVSITLVFIERNLNYKLSITIMFMIFILFVFTIIFFQKSTQPQGVA